MESRRPIANNILWLGVQLGYDPTQPALSV